MSGSPEAKDSRLSGENERRILVRDRNPFLFRPIDLRSVTVRNRIMLSPMCQYSATDGLVNRWHLVHLGARAAGGAGIVFTEAVHTEARGRITHHCLGLWNDEQRDGLAEIAEFVAGQGAVPGIQLGHAGRKASVTRPWESAKPIAPKQGGWDVVSASSAPYAKDWPVPAELSQYEIAQQHDLLASATRRARQAGFKVLELHGGHGYLVHQFLSPLSNVRTDDYGGSFENRSRFLLETIAAIRSEWPDELPLFIRLSITDWVDGGWSVADSVALAKLIGEGGQVDLIDCSSGGNDPRQSIPIHPGYQVPLSSEVRKQSGMKTGAVGLIHSAEHAESILANGDADIVILGRAFLANPMWPLHAANTLKKADHPWPIQYERSNIY